MNRRLNLRKETLAQLGKTELRAVGGASHLCGATDPCTHSPSCQLAGCPTVGEECPTNPVLVCIRTVLCVQTS